MIRGPDAPTRCPKAPALPPGQGPSALLVATGHGVRTSMLRQAVEWPGLREAMRGPRRRCSPHALIRFGYASDGGRTPRAAPARPTEN